MDTTRDVYESEITLRTTNERASILLVCTAVSVAFFLWILSDVLGDLPRSRKPFLVILDIVFFILSLMGLNAGIRSSLRGKIKTDSTSLIIEQDGRRKSIPFANISNIALTKTLSGRSFVQIIVISTTDFKRTYIWDHYDVDTELIFEFLKTELEREGLGIKFYVRPAFSII